MNESNGRFCRLYRPIGALLLLLAILFLLWRSPRVQVPVAAVPTVEATHTTPLTVAPTTVPPTTVAPTAVPAVLPTLNLPAVADLTADGVELSGTGEPGATVELWDGATRVGSALVSADGTWSLVAALSEGAHALAIRTLDAAGNVLNELPAVEVTVPGAIAVPTLNLPAVADLTADGVKLSGTGEPGATVEVWEGATKIGTAVVGADGIWSLVSKLDEGAHALAVRTVDAAGNVLNELPAVEVTLPAAMVLPTLNLPTTADYTVDGLKLSGTGEPGATVEVWEGATKIGTAVVGEDGTWSFVAMLSEGVHALAVRTVDAAGQTLNELPAVEVSVPEAQVPGQVYIVEWGDWLMEVARRFYGDADLYTWIIDATNAKAAVDPTFAKIRNPNLIMVGQKLWIPAKMTGK